jgi:hypothetical protein
VESGYIYAIGATKLNLPDLMKSGEIYANSAIVIYGRPGIQGRLRNTSVKVTQKEKMG